MSEKIKEQSILINSLKGEGIGFLEQITQLCGALEDKERELMKFMQLYEQKANDVAQYMQEVGLLINLPR
ncbi:unnamed protein product [Dicrocoelium dendriticum]|nr:unnamed protein product [Dicrocoelium dendriticum]